MNSFSQAHKGIYWVFTKCHILLEALKWRTIVWSPLKSFCVVSYWAKQDEMSDIILSVEYVKLWLGDVLWCGDTWPRQLNLWDRSYPILEQKDAGISVNKLFILKVTQTVSLVNRSYLREASKQQQTPSNLVLQKNKMECVWEVCLGPHVWPCAKIENWCLVKKKRTRENQGEVTGCGYSMGLPSPWLRSDQCDRRNRTLYHWWKE